MELRAWAEAILRGATLEEKLLHPGSFSDAEPGAALERPPETPGRVRALAPTRERVAPPPLERLEEPAARAQVLHSFANHELQALELQALALLRFPDAPADLRQELARVLVEEQSHCRLYLERCRALGLELGDAPLSRYLWDALAGMERPLDYVTGMALTFEQANLDFAADYERRFLAVGDAESAAILRRVYEEELGHVRLGAAWLARLVPERGDWEAYREHLPPGLTPRRARGSGAFQREARLAAGLSETFLAELEVCGGSRGRPPTLRWFRPGAERSLAPGGGPRTPPRSHALLGADLAMSLALSGRDDDLVVVPTLPSLAWRQELARLGLPRAEWIVAEPEGVAGAVEAALGPRGLGEVSPWAWDPVAIRALAPLAAPPLPREELARLSAKPWAAARLDELCQDPRWAPLVVRERGHTYASWGELAPHLEAEESWRVLKAPLASSGEGLRRLAPGEGLSPQLRAWAERALAQGGVRLEPWHARVADLSLVFEVGPEGLSAPPCLTAFRSDERGRYRGHWVGPARRFLDSDVLRLLHESRADTGGARGLDLLEAAAAHAARRLAEAGYRGPAGVDALVAREGELLRLQPLLELNLRWTFGHLARDLAGRLRRGRLGLLALVARAAWERAGWAQARDLAQALPAATLAEGGLAGGVLALNDPAQAQVCLSLLSVAASRAACQAQLSAALPDVARGWGERAGAE